MRIDTRLCEQCSCQLERRHRESPKHWQARRFCGRDCQGIARAGDAAARFAALVTRCGEDDCWEWAGLRSDRGYGLFTFRQKSWRAHRFALHLMGQDVADKVVLHSCDNPPCCNPKHLSVGTYADNNADMLTKGRQRHPVGTASPNAKLTEKDVRGIRASQEPYSVLSARFGVAISAISNVRTGKTWGHIV